MEIKITQAFLSFLFVAFITLSSASAAPISFNINSSVSAITSTTPDNALSDYVQGDYDFDQLDFSGGSSISVSDPIVLNSSYSESTSVAPLINASITSTTSVTYENLSFDIDSGFAKDGSNPASQSWTAESDVYIQSSGSIEVTGLGTVNYTIDTVKNISSSATLNNSGESVSLSSNTTGSDIELPFSTTLPLEIDASEITLDGSLGLYTDIVIDLIVDKINSANSSVCGHVIAHSDQSLDIPEDVSFQVVERQSIVNISTDNGISISANMTGSFNGLRNIDSARIDSSTQQQVNEGFIINSPTLDIASTPAYDVSGHVDNGSIEMNYSFVSDVFQDGDPSSTIDLIVDQLEINIFGEIFLDANVPLFVDDSGRYQISAAFDPFTINLNADDAISMHIDSGYEFLVVPFNVDIESLLQNILIDLDLTGFDIAGINLVEDLLLSSSFIATIIEEQLSSLNLSGEAVTRRSIAAVPAPSTLLLMVSGLAGLGFASRRKKHS